MKAFTFKSHSTSPSQALLQEEGPQGSHSAQEQEAQFILQPPQKSLINYTTITSGSGTDSNRLNFADTFSAAV